MSDLNIQNEPNTVPSNVKNLFYNSIPFGSDYLIYTKSYSNTSQLYECIVVEPVTNEVHVYQVSHQAGGDYVFSEVQNNYSSFDKIISENPYYSFSSYSGQGVKEALPINSDIITFMLIVIASILVLKTVFGGIRLWSNRRKNIY